MCWNLQKNMVYDMIKCYWYMIWSSLTLTVLILILHFENPNWYLTKNRILTREIKVLGWLCDWMPARLLFSKSKVIIFSSCCKSYRQSKLIFTISVLSKYRKYFYHKSQIRVYFPQQYLQDTISRQRNIKLQAFFSNLVATKFNTHKATSGWRKTKLNTHEI